MSRAPRDEQDSHGLGPGPHLHPGLQGRGAAEHRRRFEDDHHHEEAGRRLGDRGARGGRQTAARHRDGRSARREGRGALAVLQRAREAQIPETKRDRARPLPGSGEPGGHGEPERLVRPAPRAEDAARSRCLGRAPGPRGPTRGRGGGLSPAQDSPRRGGEHGRSAAGRARRAQPLHARRAVSLRERTPHPGPSFRPRGVCGLPQFPAGEASPRLHPLSGHAARGRGRERPPRQAGGALPLRVGRLRPRARERRRRAGRAARAGAARFRPPGRRPRGGERYAFGGGRSAGEESSIPPATPALLGGGGILWRPLRRRGVRRLGGGAAAGVEASASAPPPPASSPPEPEAPSPIERMLEPPHPSDPVVLSECRYLGQWEECFLLFASPQGLVLVDQHAAHERVLYNRFRDQFREGRVDSQACLVPEEIRLRPEEALGIEAHHEDLLRSGFELECAAPGEYRIRAVPALLADRDPAGAVRQVAEGLAIWSSP